MILKILEKSDLMLIVWSLAFPMLQSFFRKDIRGKSVQTSRNRAEGLLAS